MSNVTVTGNDNYVIVAGGDVYLSPLPEAPPTGDDRRNLANLLALVRRIWITNVLEQSVKHAALLDPELRMAPDAVGDHWRRYMESVDQPPKLLSPDHGIGRVFEDARRALLILGEPGAGKTTALLTLARESIEIAERDPAAPVPVVVNLSSWTDSRLFRDWLVGELADGYGVGRKLARRWLKEHRLLLLLDGLDEVPAERRAACAAALHAFVEEHGVPGLAVCCRTAEYRALPFRMKLGGAVDLLPLEQARIDAYLAAAGPAVGGLREALARNEELRGLSTSPLMLSIMTLALRDLPADAMRFERTSTREELREEIFGRFVDRMFVLRERSDDGFSRARMVDGLRWLASGMKERGSIFAVELLQPEWLTPRQLLLYTLASRAGGATAVALVIGAVVYLAAVVLVLVVGGTISQALSSTGALAAVAATLAASVAMGVAVGFFYLPLGYHTLRRSRERGRRGPGMVEELAIFLAYMGLSALAALLVGQIGQRVFGPASRHSYLVVAVITMAVCVLSMPLLFGSRPGRGSVDRDISLAGTMSWRWRPAVELAVVGTLSGAITILFAPSRGITSSSAIVLVSIVTYTIAVYGGWRQEVPPVDRWNDREGNSALRKSGKVFAVAASACVLTLFPVLLLLLGADQSPRNTFALTVLVAIMLFSPALFWFGGLDLVLHATLRLILALTGTMPLRLRRFLDYAVHLGFLRRAGGGYIFFHRLLLEHFAAKPSPARPGG